MFTTVYLHPPISGWSSREGKRSSHNRPALLSVLLVCAKSKGHQSLMTTDDGTSCANQKTLYKQHCLGLWEVKSCTVAVVSPVYWVVKKVSLFLSQPQALHMTGEKVTWQQAPASWPFFASSVSPSPSCWWLWPWNVSDHQGPTLRGSKTCRWWVGGGGGEGPGVLTDLILFHLIQMWSNLYQIWCITLSDESDKGY